MCVCVCFFVGCGFLFCSDSRYVQLLRLLNLRAICSSSWQEILKIETQDKIKAVERDVSNTVIVNLSVSV